MIFSIIVYLPIVRRLTCCEKQNKLYDWHSSLRNIDFKPVLLSCHLFWYKNRMVHHSNSYGNFLHNLRIACLPCQKVGCTVYQRSNHYDCFCIHSAVFTWKHTWAIELCYYSGFKTAFAISSRTEQNHFGRYPRHKCNRTFCVHFGNTERSFYNQPDTIQAYFDSVIAVNGTACPLLHSYKHSSVRSFVFLLQLQVLLPCTFQRTHANSDRHRAVWLRQFHSEQCLLWWQFCLRSIRLKNMSDLTGRKTFCRALKTALILMTDEKLPQKKTLMKSKVHLKKKKISAISLRWRRRIHLLWRSLRQLAVIFISKAQHMPTIGTIYGVSFRQ